MKLTAAIVAVTSAATIAFADPDPDVAPCAGLCTAYVKGCAQSCDGEGKHPLDGKGDPKDPDMSCDRICSLMEEKGCALEENPPIDGIWHGWAPGFFPNPTDPQGPALPNQYLTPNGDVGGDCRGDSLPITPFDALALGWTDEGGGLWTNDDSAFSMHFEGDELSGFDVTGPAFAFPIKGTTDNGDGTITYQLRFQGCNWLLGDKVEIPLTVEEAEKAKWKQGSCLESMGGSHYYKPGLSLPGVVPIYNKYGDGKLNAIIAVFGTEVFPCFGLPFQPLTECPGPYECPNGGEFDLLGSAVPYGQGCSTTFCGEPECDFDPLGPPFTTQVHVFFKNPSFSGSGFPIAQCSNSEGPCWAKLNDPASALEGFSCDCPASEDI